MPMSPSCEAEEDERQREGDTRAESRVLPRIRLGKREANVSIEYEEAQKKARDKNILLHLVN